MASLIDRIHSAMSELSQRPWDDDSLIYTNMKDFEDEIDFLARFVDCIRYRSDALEVAAHLGSVVTKVEASVQKIGGEFLEEINRDKWASVFSAMSFNLLGSSEKKDTVWIELFRKWIGMMLALRHDVRDALDSFSIKSVHCKFSVHDFSKWESFVISTYKHVEDVQGYFWAHYRWWPKRESKIRIVEGPSYLERLLGNLENDHIKDPKIEALLTKFGSSIISAELLCCQWWSSNSNTPRKEDISAALRDLDQMIWLTNPEFVDVILRLLKTSERFSTVAELVVNRYIPFTGPLSKVNNENIMFHTLGSELISFITCVLKMPDDDNMMVRMFLSDAKQLLMETASLRHSLYEVKDKSVARNLVEKIWLIKIEILLRLEITGDDIISSSIRKSSEIRALNHIVAVIRESSDASAAGSKIMNQILMLMEEVAKEIPVRPFVPLVPIPKVRKSAAIMVVRNLLLKTLLFKGELMFLKLNDSLLLGTFKDYVESLHEGFKLMIPSVISQQGENFNGGKTEFAVVESVASKIISLYHQILDQNISEEMLRIINSSSLPDLHLLDDIKLIMKELKETYLPVQIAVFPYTNAVGFSNCLQAKLQELRNYEMDLVESIITKEQISEIIELLEFFCPFLQDLFEDTTSQELKDLCIRALNLTYEAEYFIDSVISGKEADDWRNMIWLYHFLQEIRDLKVKLSQNQVKRTSKVKIHMISRGTTPDIDEGVVSLVDEEQSIIDRLMGGSEKLYSVSIVGMPGIGKTTLAKKVYNNPDVARFWMRAWCCVSEVYRRRDVLLEILSHMIALTADIMEMTNEDLEFKLYKILLTKRYLIVLDDVWDTEVLDDIVRRFPDNEDNSRILITSRNDSVALKANPDADPHHLRHLYDRESWMLLQKKIFHEEPCPDELKVIGEEIAVSCKGLPLAVIAIAGLLERIERQHDRWKDIAESLTSKIVDDPQEQWRRILELSYENLPDCLQACFLYFGAFLEDQDIPASKLMHLWIAEGFVPETELKTMEDVAEDYLMDLIGRSLVMLSKERSLGGVKACRVHDVLRKLCQSKAKEDKFLQVITRSNATLHDLDYVFGADFRDPTSSAVKYEDRRLCFCSKRKHFIDSRPLGPHVRSLLCFANGDEDPKYPYDISFISQNFGFLKVLDLECINMGNSFAEDILLLVQLKYLAVAGYIHSIPSSIANLRNLETFIVRGFREKVKLPHQLWSLKRLRHVRVCDFAALDREENSSQAQPDCLVTASSLILPSGKKTDRFLKKCQNLKKLKCMFTKSPREAADQNCNQDRFPSLEVLNELESLKITYYGRDVGSTDFSFPSNLKKLTLSNFRLPWAKMSVIGGLQKLEVLKLLSQAFVGEEWEMLEGEFPQLKYLKLENLDFAKWNPNGDNLPRLKKLVLRSCKNLEVPVDILDVPTLQIIDVQWCGEIVEYSARQIREDGDENLKVFINFAELQIPLA